VAATHFPIVFEPEATGVISAYVAGLPVYAQGSTQPQVERAIRTTLSAYLEAPGRTSDGVRLSSTSSARLPSSAAARARKAASSRANGQIGGRPRKARRQIAAEVVALDIVAMCSDGNAAANGWLSLDM
jgi:hypothetical protein